MDKVSMASAPSRMGSLVGFITAKFVPRATNSISAAPPDRPNAPPSAHDSLE